MCWQERLSTGLQAGGLPWMLLGWLMLSGCSDDMGLQPSFQSQEAPRKHSPSQSVPLKSRRHLLSRPAPSPSLITEGQTLFSVNCGHCHGDRGIGDGPVAGYLRTLPTNLQAPSIRQLGASYYYGVISRGKGAMPGFDKLLSVKERWALAYFAQSLGST